MFLYKHPDFDNHEQVTFFCDEKTGLRAIVALHTTAPMGLAGGGCRFYPYRDDAEALRDVLRLSRAMSYKLALCDMPAGGAKSVVIGDPAKDKTEPLLRALGRCVEQLGGRYVIAEDVGTTPEDMRVIAKETRYVVGRSTDTGPPTAYGVFVGLRTAVREATGNSNLTGLTVAVQGLGNVGRRLCRHLVHAGADLIVTDVNQAAIEALFTDLKNSEGPQVERRVKVVTPDALYDQNAFVYAPCALGAVLNDLTIPRLTCKVIAGAANNQLAEERHADELYRRGIVYAPDFIVNSGGVIGASHELHEVVGTGGVPTPEQEAQSFRDTEKIAGLLEQAFDLARGQGISPHVAGVTMAKNKIRERRSMTG
ncbi:MAG: Glu/Leu/Phe/Val dehydrogenase [Polyangiaceae bacterium]|nr:Glu/Leu/Phe/Val dehydrogenase [Polyangiaceae bacterium]